MNTQIRKGAKSFFDDINFPRGFSRCGEFTIQESNFLNDYGYSLQQLSNGSLMPENAEEVRFADVCTGRELAQSFAEKTWMKYISLASPRKYENVYGMGRPQNNFESGEYFLEL
jgi:uncharacterized protein YifE (UPF0438 family)